MFIQRDYSRTPHDDFALNVAYLCGENRSATPQYKEDWTQEPIKKDQEPTLLGWIIKPLYE